MIDISDYEFKRAKDAIMALTVLAQQYIVDLANDEFGTELGPEDVGAILESMFDNIREYEGRSVPVFAMDLIADYLADSGADKMECPMCHEQEDSTRIEDHGICRECGHVEERMHYADYLYETGKEDGLY